MEGGSQINRIRSNINALLNETKLERKASFMLFFRSPLDLILILGPFITGVAAFSFSSRGIEGNSGVTLARQALEEALLLRFLLGVKIAIIVISGIFVVFRWSQIQSNGSYGYWVSLGLDRDVFYLYSFLVFLLYFYASVILGYISIGMMGGPVITIFSIITSFALIFSSVLNMFGLGVIIAEIFKNPPLAMITYIGILGGNFFFNQSRNFLFLVFQSDLSVGTTDVLSTFVLSVATGVLLMLIGRAMHLRAEIEL